MRILIVLAEPYLPQQTGGAQTTTLELLSAFTQNGDDVAVAATLKRKSMLGVRATAQMLLRRRSFLVDRFQSHRVFRVPDIHRNIAAVVAAFKPDVALVQAMSAMPVAHAITALGLPMVVYWHDAERRRMNGSPNGLVARYIANSNFTAAFYAEHFGVVSAVVPPLILRERYRALPRKPQSVVFIGTVPEKGLELAIGVAEACPDIPFEFIESWTLPPARKAALRSRLARMPNVSFVPHQSNMLAVYGRARILLAPSQWQEAWGRIASEAHINGIPVVGSRIGGLREAIGPGGILVEPTAPVSEWADAVRMLWNDEAAYSNLSAVAEDYSRRPELDPGQAVQRIRTELQAAQDGSLPAAMRS